MLTAIAIQGQVKFPENLEHYDATKALIDQEQIRGHHWSVIDKTARNAIPEDKREIGMLVTWIESSAYVTKRFEGANVTNAQWTSDSNWRQLTDQNDTITYADTSFYALEADTSNFVRSLVSVDSIQFDKIAAANTHSEGTLKYDSVTHSMQFQNDIEEFNHNLGYELAVRVYNESGAQIDNGKVVTLAGLYVNGYRTPTIKLAQIDSVENLKPIGVTTVDIPNNSYGIVTVIGEVKGLNTSGFPVGSTLYVDSDGGLTLTPPQPPEYSLEIGYSFYSDAIEGSIYVQPQNPKFYEFPHFAADTSNISFAVSVAVTNTYYYLPLSSAQIRDTVGVIVAGDSVQVMTTGHYNITLGMSFNGNPTTEVWRYGMFRNGTPLFTKSRSTSSSATGDVNVFRYAILNKNDWVSFKIRNQSGTGDPTVIDIGFDISLDHE